MALFDISGSGWVWKRGCDEDEEVDDGDGEHDGMGELADPIRQLLWVETLYGSLLKCRRGGRKGLAGDLAASISHKPVVGRIGFAIDLPISLPSLHSHLWRYFPGKIYRSA